MKLHANAALSPNGRRVSRQRAIERGWALTKAARRR
jgi:hypothetical protein